MKFKEPCWKYFDKLGLQIGKPAKPKDNIYIPGAIGTTFFTRTPSTSNSDELISSIESSLTTTTNGEFLYYQLP